MCYFLHICGLIWQNVQIVVAHAECKIQFLLNFSAITICQNDSVQSHIMRVKEKYDFSCILCKLCGECDKGFWSFLNLLTLLRNTSRRGKSMASAVIEFWCVDCTLEPLSLLSNRQTQSTRFGLYVCFFYCMHKHRDVVSLIWKTLMLLVGDRQYKFIVAERVNRMRSADCQ